MNKQILKISVFSLITFSLLAFKVGDKIELVNFLNARSTAKFNLSAKNIQTSLDVGTRGEIKEMKKFPSGNFGLKMTVENGPHSGKSYWVYYNVKKPGMKLFDQKMEERKPAEIDQAKNATLIEKQNAIRDPDEQIIADAAEMSRTVLLNKKSTEVVLPSIPECAPLSEMSQGVTAENYNESSVVAPFNEIATSPLRSLGCQGNDSGYETCKARGNNMVEGFKITNNGPNKIVKSNEYYLNRQFSFEFEDQARSDMKLVVSDSIDDTTSNTTYNVMLFFPRTVLPAVKRVGDELVVTLPTKEIVRFNAKTKEVIGGVFTEGPTAPLPNKKAKPADLQYTGDGVMIRAHKSGDLPYGDTEINGKTVPSTSTTVISKKGHKNCMVPAREIWYTDHDKGGNVFIKPELASDKGLDSFIKKRCGFSLY